MAEISRANLHIPSELCLSSELGAVVVPPHPQPGPFIFTVRLERMSCEACRSGSRLPCGPHHQIIKFPRSGRSGRTEALSHPLKVLPEVLSLSLSLLISCSLFLRGSWVSPYHRPASALTVGPSTSAVCVHGWKSPLMVEKFRITGNVRAQSGAIWSVTQVTLSQGQAKIIFHLCFCI